MELERLVLASILQAFGEKRLPQSTLFPERAPELGPLSLPRSAMRLARVRRAKHAGSPLRWRRRLAPGASVGGRREGENFAVVSGRRSLIYDVSEEGRRSWAVGC